MELIFSYSRNGRRLPSVHKHHIVHRDIKPENILLSSDDIVKLTDFGISQRFEEEDIFTCGGSGTPHYMAPEMLIDGLQSPGPFGLG